MVKSSVIVIVIDLTHRLVNEVNHPLIFKQVAHTAFKLAAFYIGRKLLQIDQGIRQIVAVVIDFLIYAVTV